MQVFGNIATAPERKVGKGDRAYYVFRLAENQGKAEQRTTTWYDVVAFIDDLEADMLNVRDFVKVTARLEIEAFSRRDGTPGASAKLLAFSVEPVTRKEQPSNSEEGHVPA
jgi:hypothetical protein